MQKEITVVRYGYQLNNSGWTPDVHWQGLQDFIDNLDSQLTSLGISVSYLEEPDTILEVMGYGDLLNVIRLRSPKDHISNLCLGHIIGQSENCDFFEDIRRGVVSVAHGFPNGLEINGSGKHSGTSTSALLDDEIEYDPISGLPVMSAVPVSVSAAERQAHG